jgi:hypothetical protein
MRVDREQHTPAALHKDDKPNDTNTGTSLSCRVEGREDMARILNRKRPMDFGSGRIPNVFPGDDFESQRPFIGQASGEALTGQNAEFNFGHV